MPSIQEHAHFDTPVRYCTGSLLLENQRKSRFMYICFILFALAGQLCLGGGYRCSVGRAYRLVHQCAHASNKLNAGRVLPGIRAGYSVESAVSRALLCLLFVCVWYTHLLGESGVLEKRIIFAIESNQPTTASKFQRLYFLLVLYCTCVFFVRLERGRLLSGTCVE